MILKTSLKVGESDGRTWSGGHGTSRERVNVPIYQYQVPELGINIELRRKVEDRDKPLSVERVLIPERIGLAGTDTGRRNAPSIDRSIAEGRRAVETPPTRTVVQGASLGGGEPCP